MIVDIEDALDRDEVYTYRMGRYLDMGFDVEAADLLAHSEHVDWHEIARFIHQGCDPETAARILL